MAVGPYAWSTTAADNDDADTNINFAEGQTPASLNNSNRAMMAALAGWLDSIGGAATYGGSSSDYTITNPSVAAWASYATGQLIALKANHTNDDTTVQLNVDGLGNQRIKTNDGGDPAIGDIVSGGIYLLAYDGTNGYFQILNTIAGGSYQPLDATLTALAALSWSSGNALVQFTADNVVSLTLTPSVTSITASNATGATTPAGTFTNTTDSAAVEALRLQGDRATPANGDTLNLPFYLSDSAGNQTAFAQISAWATVVTDASEVGRLRFDTLAGGSLTTRMILFTNALYPNVNDGIGLGQATLGFSDLFLASGAVIGFANGNFTLTHSSGLLSANGAIQARVPLSSETSGTLSSASANKKCALAGNITLNDGVFTADDFVLLDPGTSSRTVTRDTGATMYVNGTDSASATLAANQMGTAHWRTAAVAVLSGAFT